MKGITINPHISRVHLTVPDVLKAGDGVRWDELEHRLLEPNGNQVPQLELCFGSRECASDLLRLVLEENALSRLYALDKVAFEGYPPFWIRSQDIRNMPTHHTVGDFTITLDTTQRIEWLLRWRTEDKKAYLDHLLETARARAQAEGPKDKARTEAAVVEEPSERPLGGDCDGDHDGGRDEEDDGEGGRRSGEGSEGDKGGAGSRGSEDGDGGGEEDEDGGGEEGESAGHIGSNEPVGERGERRDGQAED